MSVKLTNRRNGLNKGFSGLLKKEIDRLFEENIDRKRDMCQDVGKNWTRATKSCCRKPDIEGDNWFWIKCKRCKFLTITFSRKPDIEDNNMWQCTSYFEQKVWYKKKSKDVLPYISGKLRLFLLRHKIIKPLTYTTDCVIL